MNVDAFVAGYRLGHDGHSPALQEATLMRELDDIESTKPNANNEHDWAWHLIGWSVGQAVAQHRMGAP